MILLRFCGLCVLACAFYGMPVLAQSKLAKEAKFGNSPDETPRLLGQQKDVDFATKARRVIELPEKQVLELRGAKGAPLPPIEDEARRIKRNSTVLAEDFVDTIENGFCALGPIGPAVLKSFSGIAIGGAGNIPIPWTAGFVAAGIGCDVALVRDRNESKKAGKQKIARGLGCAVEAKVGRIPGVEADVDVLFNCEPKDLAGFGLHANLGGYSIKTTMYTPRDQAKIRADEVENLTKELQTTRRELGKSLDALKKSPNFKGIEKAMNAQVPNSKGASIGGMMSKMTEFHEEGLKKIDDILKEIHRHRRVLDKGSEDNIKQIVQAGNLSKLMEAQAVLESLTSSLNAAVAGQYELDFYRVPSLRGWRTRVDWKLKKGALDALERPFDFGSEYTGATFGHLDAERRFDLANDPFQLKRKNVVGFLMDPKGKMVGALLRRNHPGMAETKMSSEGKEWKVIPKTIAKGEVDYGGLKLKKSLLDALGPDLVVALPPGTKDGEGLTAVSALEVKELRDHYTKVVGDTKKLKQTLESLNRVNTDSAREGKANGWKKGTGGWFNGCFALSFPVKDLLTQGPKLAVASVFRNALPTLLSMGLIGGALLGEIQSQKSPQGSKGAKVQDFITQNAKFAGQTGGVLGGTVAAERLMSHGHGHPPTSMGELLKKNFTPHFGHELYLGAYYLQKISSDKIDAGKRMGNLFDRIDSGQVCKEKTVAEKEPEPIPHKAKNDPPSKQAAEPNVKQDSRESALGEKKKETPTHTGRLEPDWKTADAQSKTKDQNAGAPRGNENPKSRPAPAMFDWKGHEKNGAGVAVVESKSKQGQSATAERDRRLERDRPRFDRDRFRIENAKKLSR